MRIEPLPCAVLLGRILVGIALGTSVGGCPSGAADAPSNPAAAKEDAMVHEHGPAAVSTAADAVAVFTRFWRNELKPRIASRESAQRLDGLVQAPATPPSVSRRSYEDYRTLFAQRVSNQAQSAAILHGSPQLLKGTGSCWAIQYDGLLGPGLGACVDVERGTVLLVWETPEG